MAARQNKHRLSISGLVPPQQPCTPVGSEFCPSPGAETDGMDLTKLPTDDEELLVQRLQNLRLTVNGIDKFKPIPHEPELNYSEACKLATNLSNDVTRIHNLVCKCIMEYSKGSEGMEKLPRERLEEYVARYNGLLSVLLEVPSHIKFGLKTTILSYVNNVEAAWFRSDLERKLGKSGDYCQTIEQKIEFLEQYVERERCKASDDSKIGMKSKSEREASEFDTRRRRYNTSMK
ncbi:hypothetical protein TWF694_006312 [Orbilia ellipsospora]|uniref:Uncharacterized protein n=1 Tax=Orbilia ellipsospora TaxID=2528407 RepID=A0AAV9XK51_9PEZI